MRPGDRRALAVVCGATALLLLDVTVVNVALPEIARDLDASFSEVQWVIDAYAVGLAALLLTAGALADRLGRRRVFLVGLLGFGVTSALCAAAPSALALDLARGAQGVAAAAIFATSLAILAAQFDESRRGFALGVWGAVSGAAIAAGPLAGGAVVEGLDWRWIFWVNLPLCALLIGLGLGIAETRDRAPRRPDPVGATTFTLALLALVVGLIRGNDAGWGSAEGLAPFIAAAALAAAFVWVELRSPDPMLDVRLFRRPAFAGTAIVAFGQSVAIYPMFLFIAIWMQEILGHDPLETGVRIMPLTLAIFAFAPLGGRLTGRMRLGPLIAAALVLMGVGLLLMRVVEPDSEWTALLPGLLVGGAGVGLISPALAAAMVAVLPVERAGLASGINNTFRQVGIAAGLAGLGAVFEHTATADASLRVGVVDGLDRVFLLGAAVSFVTAIVAWATLRGPSPGAARGGISAYAGSPSPDSSGG